MNKLDMKSKDIIKGNIDYIKEKFPNIVVETNKGYEIDFNLLKQELSDIIVDENKEKYQLTWPGKKESILNANKPTKNTLRPLKEKSIDFDNTENIYIEGDNLEALKILQESYLNKIKCIYIDPPYNTGNDYIYNDDFSKSLKDELIESGQIDENGNRFIANMQSNGRFHSDWISMMYSRLKLARNLLTNDGVIFISIDDNEQSNLRKICDEIFGDNNFIANIIWQKKFSPQNDAKWFSDNHDFIVCYSKNKELYRPVLIERSEESDSRYKNPDNDPRGKWASSDLSVKTYSAAYDYSIKTPSGKEISLPAGRCWMTSKENMKKLIDDNRIWFGEKGENLPRLKRFLSEVKQGITPLTVWLRDEVGDTQESKKELLSIMPENIFQTPKPTRLIDKILKLSVNDGDIVLDFFSGSATTAHSVMKFNKKIKYIMIQAPEKTNRIDYPTLCDVGEERIRRASKKIKEETDAKIDKGFRVYKIDSSNMKDVYYKPNDLKQEQLKMFESNIKEDRNNEDLLIQVMLDLGLTLDLKIEEKKILNNKVYFVDSNSLVACFDENINIDIIDEICKEKPLKVIFKDSSFKMDNDKINLQEKIKKLSPDTEVTVL
jgi:adenine-specific DNA-methyltransferase